MKLDFLRGLCYGLIFTSLNFLWVTTLLMKIAVAESLNSSLSEGQCPQEVAELANLMTTNISNYGNRVIQKNSAYSRKLDFLPTYIITTSQAEIEPLPLHQFQTPTNDNSDDVQQIFFTTLERQYSTEQRVIETQNYHWLIITQTDAGWKLVMALTRFGYPNGDEFLVSPPRDTTQGIMGQAVKLWLRDCESGTLR